MAHASWAFLSNQIRNKEIIPLIYARDGTPSNEVLACCCIDKDVYEQWFCGIFTKTICEAKNLNQLLKAKIIAEELGMKEGKDFFLIWDACLTELEPEKYDEDGTGRTLTCIGFKPLDDETAWKISKKFQLYK